MRRPALICWAYGRFLKLSSRRCCGITRPVAAENLSWDSRAWCTSAIYSRTNVIQAHEVHGSLSQDTFRPSAWRSDGPRGQRCVPKLSSPMSDSQQSMMLAALVALHTDRAVMVL